MQTLNGGDSVWVTADIFDTDSEARMIEHWDMISEWVDDTVSGHTQVDGPSEPTDLHKTEGNKSLVTAFVTQVLQNGDFGNVSDFISTETFTQHNPQIGDGLEGFLAFLDSLVDQDQSIVYEEIHKIVGCGNYVAVMSKMNLAGTDFAVIDLYRIEDGHIVEHWDVMEQILPTAQWVNSGKF